MRLADEYDAAQERGEVAGHGGDKVSNVAKSNVATAADLGLRRDEIHEARKLRDVERGFAAIRTAKLGDKSGDNTKKTHEGPNWASVNH